MTIKLPKSEEVIPKKPQSLVVSGQLTDASFVSYFLKAHHCMCISGSIWDEREKWRTDEAIRQEIQRAIGPYVQRGLAKRTQELLAAIKNEAYVEPPKPDENKVHFLNGYYDIRDGVFYSNSEFSYCTVPHDLTIEKTPTPKFTEYLNGLLEPEDVATLQEFTGYCLIPCNKADSMLYLIGSGEEGKSVFGKILEAVLGKTMVTGSLHDLTGRFGLASLENKLLFLDDDLSLKGFAETAPIKKIVTCRGQIQYERKGKDAYNGPCFCKLLAFGNGVPADLYDHTHGAERRKLIITTKPKPAERKKNANLAQEIIDEELNGVIMWALAGLRRLHKNGWKISQSKRTQENLETFKDEYAPAAFLKDTDVVKVGNPDDEVGSMALQEAYRAWCYTNGYKCTDQRAICSHIKSNGQRLNIQEVPHIKKKAPGKRQGPRGFKGLALVAQ